jgi:hypothetical protein
VRLTTINKHVKIKEKGMETFSRVSKRDFVTAGPRKGLSTIGRFDSKARMNCNC